MAELGYQYDGLRGWGSFTDTAHETNPELVFPKSLETFDKMRREDAQVSSVLRAMTLPIRKARWQIDGAGCRPEVVAHISNDLRIPIKGQDSVAMLRTRGRFSWAEHLRLALLELPLGISPFEQVYRIEKGLAHLAKLAWRSPRTIVDIEVARDGGLIALVQQGSGGSKDVRIPVDRLVVYVNEREGGNWLGQSLLRPAYKNWLLKDRLLRIQALSAERNGIGIPKHTAPSVPDGVSQEDYAAREKELVDAGLEVAKDLRAGETAGVSLPAGAELELMGVTGKLPDTNGPIRYHDEQIARGMLAHFLNLGTETGSWALGSTFANFFTDSLNATGDHLADVTQQHVIEDLVDLNWGPQEPAPRLVFEPIGSNHPATAEAIKALVDCGALKPDEAMESHIRTIYGLPAKAASTEESA